MHQGKKGVGLNPNTYIQLTDHLAPLCVIMDMPLLLTDSAHAEDVSKYYPGINVLLMDWVDVTFQRLAEEFDVFFQSEYWNRQSFYKNIQKLEKELGKILRNVHCPHGFSDKIFWLEHGVWEDILLVYGENMMDLFRHKNIESHLNTTVRTGNYRYSYYQQHQVFYDKLFQDIVGHRLDSEKKTILYAPTCNDQEHSTSLLQAEELLKNLPDHYNLIVKFHPRMEETDEVFIYDLKKKYQQQSNIIFLEKFSLVYPLLAHADIYVGDRSSIGYDFLVFNRPMFFLNQLKGDAVHDRNLFLYRCGTEILPEQYGNFYQILEEQLLVDQSLYADIRKKVYDYTFGQSIPFDQLKKNIEHAYFSQKKSID